MALEILVLVLYQIRLGSLYQQLGILIAAFMAGWRPEAWRAPIDPRRVRGGTRLLAGLQVAWQSWPHPWPSGCKGVSPLGRPARSSGPGRDTSWYWRWPASAAAGSLP